MRTLLPLLLAAACDPGPPPTYHRDVRPLLEAHCLGCHDEGGIGPFVMDLGEEAWAGRPPAWVPSAVAAIEAGTMPPWMPSDDCLPVAGSRQLSDAERRTVRRWARDGMPVGRPRTYVPPAAAPAVQLEEPDLLLQAEEPYAADPTRPDDYRCFLLDHDFPDDTWVRALSVEPDRRELVHHVLLYRLDAAGGAEAEALDARDPGPGYTCYGGPGTNAVDTLAGWAPGQQPEVYPDGIARRIAQGSRLVLQVHYNTLNLEPDEAVPGDQTQLALWTLDKGELPERQLISEPLAVGNLDLPPGDPHVVAQKHFDYPDVPEGLQVIGAGPHMHQLGTSIRLERRRGLDRRCLIEVPDWDFDWQQSYFFEQEAWQDLQDGDRYTLTCTYDNSAAHQPVVNGVQQEPRRVRWGDGTLDEMCLLYAFVLGPPGLR